MNGTATRAPLNLLSANLPVPVFSVFTCIASLSSNWLSLFLPSRERFASCDDREYVSKYVINK